MRSVRALTRELSINESLNEALMTAISLSSCAFGKLRDSVVQPAGWVEHLRNPSPFRAALMLACDGYRCTQPILRADYSKRISRAVIGSIARIYGCITN